MTSIEIKKKFRTSMIIGLAVIFAGLSAVSGWLYQRPGQMTVQEPVSSWQQKANVNYNVYYRSNSLFPDEEIIGPGRAYLTALTDYVGTELHYQFTSDDEAQISGEYEVVADITGYMLVEKQGQNQQLMLEREKVLVWNKSYQLLEPTAFTGSGKEFEFNESIDVPAIDYMDFLVDVMDATRYSPELVEIKVRYHIKSEAVTSRGTITQELEPYLIIPAEGRAYRITGTMEDGKEDAFKEEHQVPVPGLRTKKNAAMAGAGILAIILLGTIFMTRVKEEDVFEEEVLKIFNNFGDRIVPASGSGLSGKDDSLLELKSFEDLIKIADEASQMILYEADGEYCYRFYLLADQIIYRYILAAEDLPDEKSLDNDSTEEAYL